MGYMKFGKESVLERVDSDEIELIRIKKHPIGLIAVYLQTGIGMLLAIGLVLFFLPSAVDDQDTMILIAALFSAVTLTLAFIMLTVFTYVYTRSKLIVTDRNITQALQYGLFSKKISQLNIVDVEDVTSVHKGIFPNIFNYGVLHIETAGEQSNFHFDFCPDPEMIAKTILDARESMLGQGREDDSTYEGHGNKKARRVKNKDKIHHVKEDSHRISALDVVSEAILHHRRQRKKNKRR